MQTFKYQFYTVCLILKVKYITHFSLNLDDIINGYFLQLRPV